MYIHVRQHSALQGVRSRAIGGGGGLDFSCNMSPDKIFLDPTIDLTILNLIPPYIKKTNTKGY